MSKGKSLQLSKVVGGIIDWKVIDMDGRTNFLVSFKTKALLDGHVIWLRREFEDWVVGIKKIPGVLEVNELRIKKALRKSEQGSIELGIVVSGAIKVGPAVNSIVVGNLVASIRKSLAMIILSDYAPDFNYEEPLFYAIHDHCYQATPCCSDWIKGNRRLKALQAGKKELKWQFDICGAILKAVNVSDENNLISMVMRWRQNATEDQRNTLEKVIRAYFSGLGFTLTNWECVSKEN